MGAFFFGVVVGVAGLIALAVWMNKRRKPAPLKPSRDKERLAAALAALVQVETNATGPIAAIARRALEADKALSGPAG